MKEYFLIYTLIIFLLVLWIDRSNKLNNNKKKNTIIKIFNFIKLPVLLLCISILSFNFLCNIKNDIKNNELTGGSIINKITNHQFLTTTPNF